MRTAALFLLAAITAMTAACATARRQDDDVLAKLSPAHGESCLALADSGPRKPAPPPFEPDGDE